MKKGFYLTLGVVLSSCLPASAQTIATNRALMEEGPPLMRAAAKDSRSIDLSRNHYNLHFTRQENVSGQRCYVLELLPRGENKNLLRQHTLVSRDARYATGERMAAGSSVTTKVHFRREENDNGPVLIQKQFIPALGVSLGNFLLPACANMRPGKLSLSHQRPEPRMIPFEMASSHWPQAASLPARSAAEPPAPPTALLVIAYKSFRGPERMFQMKTVRTPFVNQTSVALVQLWGGRLQLSGFGRMQRMEAVLNGFPGPGVLLPAGSIVPRAESSYGGSLTFHLGRNAQR